MRTTTTSYNGLGLPVAITDAAGVPTTFAYDPAGNVVSTTVGAQTPAESTTTLVYGDPSYPGDVTAVVDGRGERWDTVYDPVTGYPVSVTDPEGNETSTEYNELGWVTAAVAPAGNTAGASPQDHRASFEHNRYGDVTSVTNAEGETTVTVYDADRNPTGVTDPDGETTVYTYTAADELATVTEAAGTPEASTTSFEYLPDGSRKSWRNGLNDTWSYTYDPLGRLSAQTDPKGHATTYGYDTRSNLTTVTEPAGNCTTSTPWGCTTYAYDAAGQLTSIDYSHPDTPDVTAYTYDAVGRRQAATLSTGEASTWHWDALGQLVSHTDGAGATVDYGWDPVGNLASIRYPGQSTPVTYGYDGAGRMTGVTDWLGHTTAFGYDPNSNLLTTTFPGSTGNVDTSTYDRAGRIDRISWTRAGATLGSIDYQRAPDGLVSGATATGVPAGPDGFGYDARDQLTTVDAESVYEYDLAGNLTTTADGRLQVFDPAQQLCWSSPTATSGSCTTTPPPDATTYNYDARGNRVRETRPGGQETTYAYDQADRLTRAEVADATGAQYKPVTSATVLDTRSASRVGACPAATGQCLPLSSSNGMTRTVQVAGRAGLPTATDIEAVMLNVRVIGTDTDPAPCSGCEGSLSVYPADLQDPPAATVNFDDADTVANSVITRLDSDGRINVTANANTDVVVDVQGYFTTAAPSGGTRFDAIAPSRLMDSHGHGDCAPKYCGPLGGHNQSLNVKVRGRAGVPSDPKVTAVALTVTASRAFGPGLLLLSPTGAQPKANLAYEQGPKVSNMAIVPIGADGRITISAYGNPVDVELFVSGYFTGDTDGNHSGYHPLDSPSRIVDTAASPSPVGMCPGPDNPCTKLPAGTTTIQVTGREGLPANDVDAVVVNLTAKADSSGWMGAWADDGTSYQSTVAMAYQAGQATAANATIPVGPSGRIKIFTLSPTELTIDVQGYFASTDTVTNDYDYDSDGLRSAKTTSHTGTTHYTWSQAGGLPLLLTQSDRTGDTHLIYGPGGTPIAEITGTEAVWYHRDHLGSTRLVTDHTGTPVGTYTYDPYGTLADTTGTHRPLLGYAGQYTDPETGLQYLRARHYDPTTGQFLTRDPWVSTTMDPYGYALNNPVNATDPTGLFGIPEWVPVVGGKCVDIADPDCHSKKNEIVETLTGPGEKSLCAAGQGYFVFGAKLDLCLDWNSSQGLSSVRPSISPGGGIGSPSLGAGISANRPRRRVYELGPRRAWHLRRRLRGFRRRPVRGEHRTWLGPRPDHHGLGRQELVSNARGARRIRLHVDHEPVDLDLAIDSITLRWYRRLLVVRHGSIVIGAASAVVVASPLDSLREWTGALVILAAVVFALSMTVLLWPLCVRALRGGRTTYVRFHHSLNVLTGHALLDDLEPGDGAMVTRQSLRTLIAIEIALALLFVVVAIVA